MGRCQPPCCSPQSEPFPPQPPPSASPPSLFGCFAGTTALFDSSPAFMHGLCFWLPVPIRRLVGPGCRRGLAEAPIKGAGQVGSRACSFSTCSWLLDYAGSDNNSRLHSRQCGFPSGAQGRHPKCAFRSSIPGPSMPLSTLHPAPHGTQRKTRGQDGSLLLSCGALSSPTARRFIPTIALPCGRGSVRSF